MKPYADDRYGCCSARQARTGSAGRASVTRALLLAAALVGAWFVSAGCTSDGVAGATSKPGAEVKTHDQLREQVAHGPAIVDFSAEWCGWCKKLEPILADLEKEYDGKIRFLRVDTDRSPDLAREFGVQGLPTMVLFKDGKPFDRVEGYRSKAQLKARLDPLLK